MKRLGDVCARVWVDAGTSEIFLPSTQMLIHAVVVQTVLVSPKPTLMCPVGAIVQTLKKTRRRERSTVRLHVVGTSREEAGIQIS